jgi:alkaline phosphatase D
MFLKENPHLLFANGSRHGYATVELTPERSIARMRTVESVTRADSPISTLATYVVEAGKPGAQKA